MTEDIKDSGFNELLLKNEPKELKTFDDLVSQDREAALLNNNRSFRIFDSGTVQLVKPGLDASSPIVGYTYAETSVDHNLGYTPAFIAYVSQVDIDPDEYEHCPIVPFTLQVGTGVYANASCDATKITFYTKVQLGGLSASERTYNFKYYLLRERN